MSFTISYNGSQPQDGTDLVGPDASVGPDGIQDIHLILSGLTPLLQGKNLDHMVINGVGPSGSGFTANWETVSNPDGFSNAEAFGRQDPSTVDLYLNPVATSGGSAPPRPMPDGATLTVYVYYTDGSWDDEPIKIDNLELDGAGNPIAMPATPTPGNVVFNQFGVQDVGRDGSSTQGSVHLVVTVPSDKSVSGANWELSDAAGQEWNSAQQGNDNNGKLDVYPRNDGTNKVDVYFAPIRDESKNSNGMMLRITLAGDASEYVTQFTPGEAWDPSLLAVPLNVNGPVADNVADPTTLANLLSTTGSGEVDIIKLKPGAQITADQPMMITHSVQIIGQGATLTFEPGPDPWSSTASGALYVADTVNKDVNVDLENFTINFSADISPTNPLRWLTPPGWSPALYDPENHPADYAVIDTRGNTGSPKYAVLNLSGMTIDGPPVFDPPPPQPANGYVYVGEPAIPLIRSGGGTGSITNSNFKGGTVFLQAGPWTVTGDHFYGV